MKTCRLALISFCGLSTLALVACGEGYEMVQVRNQVPYTEERTAGPGVAYVRAHLMPEKTVVLPDPILTPQLQSAEPLFEGKVQKK
ncbi:MAG: hypothetical protein DI551_02640 [Micavibrio aeruginosavorus]|uniref:Lipoprotein n=1 Tax=Micavibrio aeruginosavorus TaxID=349221 RepID=A0A2W5N6E6_9BACT|nr:MAG: hypothetical protein DI551_02640 [Micavibrio aeruginosavorus]